MTIEERMIQAWGTTDTPELAIYLLPDGTFVNGSYCGFQRDRDHRDINEFFKPSIRQDHDVYIEKAMYRGNIRVMCDTQGYWFELAKTPTRKQVIRLYEANEQAIINRIEFGIGIRKRPNFWRPCKIYSFDEYMNHLIRYNAKAVC